MNQYSTKAMAAVVLAQSASWAQAQDMSTPPQTLDVVTVTATKEKTTLQQSPASIGVSPVGTMAPRWALMMRGTTLWGGSVRSFSRLSANSHEICFGSADSVVWRVVQHLGRPQLGLLSPSRRSAQ